MKKLFLTLFALASLNFAHAQQDSTSCCKFSLNMDIVSRYVWRGLLLSDAVNFQPMAYFNVGKFSLGTWASYAVGKNYAEVDFSASWQHNGLTLVVNDYCTIEEPMQTSFQYFNFKKASSPHAIEASASYELQGKLPLKFQTATFFYGNDRDSLGANYYSTYLELSYPVQIQSVNVNFIAGGTINRGLYGDNPGFVNLGLMARNEISINENYSIPLSLSVSANPTSNYIFVVFAITL